MNNSIHTKSYFIWSEQNVEMLEKAYQRFSYRKQGDELWIKISDYFYKQNVLVLPLQIQEKYKSLHKIPHKRKRVYKKGHRWTENESKALCKAVERCKEIHQIIKWFNVHEEISRKYPRITLKQCQDKYSYVLRKEMNKRCMASKIEKEKIQAAQEKKRESPS